MARDHAEVGAKLDAAADRRGIPQSDIGGQVPIGVAEVADRHDPQAQGVEAIQEK